MLEYGMKYIYDIYIYIIFNILYEYKQKGLALEMKRIPQELFYHGDGNYWTYIYIQNSAIYGFN